MVEQRRNRSMPKHGRDVIPQWTHKESEQPDEVQVQNLQKGPDGKMNGAKTYVHGLERDCWLSSSGSEVKQVCLGVIGSGGSICRGWIWQQGENGGESKLPLLRGPGDQTV